jgi:hypothetical protein
LILPGRSERQRVVRDLVSSTEAAWITPEDSIQRVLFIRIDFMRESTEIIKSEGVSLSKGG